MKFHLRGMTVVLFMICAPRAFAIINGTTVPDTDPVAQVVLPLYDGGNRVCTVTRIAQDTYLTAVHCLATGHEYIKVDGVNYKVASHERDPKFHFGDEAADHDVLVFTTHPAPGPQKVARLDDAPEDDLTNKGPLFIAGVGAAATHDKNHNEPLHASTFEIDDDPYPGTLSVVGTKQANHRASGVCEGDSGGPGYRVVNGEVFVWGVLSAGDNSYGGKYSKTNLCDNESFLMRVASGLPWIQEQVAKLNPQRETGQTAETGR